jgi:5-methylcytosine-specific restriction endonuclease McrA
MPSVVRFLRALRGRRKVVKFSRENVYTRDKGRCQYCDVKVTRAEFTYDHVVPKSRGGKTEWTNVVCSCVPCNQTKKNRTPVQAGMRLRVEPVKPKKLPDTISLTFTWREGMPDGWKSWLRDMSYWHGELDAD